MALAGVREDRWDDHVPVGGLDPVSGSLQLGERRAGDGLGERLAVLDRTGGSAEASSTPAASTSKSALV